MEGPADRRTFVGADLNTIIRDSVTVGVSAAGPHSGFAPATDVDSTQVGVICTRLDALLTGRAPAGAGRHRTIKDLHVTLLHLLGLDDNKLTYFHEGRFKQLSQTGGGVIKELIG